MRQLVVVRADAGPLIGGGHVMRCMALAEAMAARNWDVAFAVRSQTLDAVPSLKAASVGLILLDQSAPESEAELIRSACARPIDAIVVDHYGRDAKFERSCSAIADVVIAIDDVPNLRQHAVDMLVDGTPGHTEGDWRGCTSPSTAILAGERFALIRQAVTALRETSLRSRSGRDGVNDVIVAFGLSDSRNATLPAMRAARSAFPNSRIGVVIGPAFKFLCEVSQEADALACTVHVAPADYVERCAAADLAIGAGGVSALERACLGLPSVVVQIAENQRQGVAELVRRGAIIFAGETSNLADGWPPELLELASSKLDVLSRNSAAICDGGGVTRVAAAIDERARQFVAIR